jgi:hypothetical protein
MARGVTHLLMDNLFMALMLISIVLLIVAINKPNVLVFWSKKKTKKMAALGYSVAIVLFFILFGITAPPNTKSTSTIATTSQTSKPTVSTVSSISKSVAKPKPVVPKTDISSKVNSKSAVVSAPPKESQKQIISDYESSAKSVTIANLVKAPNAYGFGQTFEFAGIVANFLQDSSGNTTAMTISDPNDLTSFIYVQISPTCDVTKINKGDKVTIWGDGNGMVTGKNAFGTTVNEFSIIETYLADNATGYKDSADTNPL